MKHQKQQIRKQLAEVGGAPSVSLYLAAQQRGVAQPSRREANRLLAAAREEAVERIAREMEGA